MLDIERMEELQRKLKTIEKEYNQEEMLWKGRAREICKLYARLDGRMKIFASDRILLDFDFLANQVQIRLKDITDDTIFNSCVDLDDFVSDEYAQILTERYTKEMEEEREKSLQNKEEAERQELDRLLKKYGNPHYTIV